VNTFRSGLGRVTGPSGFKYWLYLGRGTRPRTGEVLLAVSSEEGANRAYTPEGLDASDVEPAIKIWPSTMGMLEKQLAESKRLTGEEVSLAQALTPITA